MFIPTSTSQAHNSCFSTVMCNGSPIGSTGTFKPNAENENRPHWCGIPFPEGNPEGDVPQHFFIERTERHDDATSGLHPILLKRGRYLGRGELHTLGVLNRESGNIPSREPSPATESEHPNFPSLRCVVVFSPFAQTEDGISRSFPIAAWRVFWR